MSCMQCATAHKCNAHVTHVLQHTLAVALIPTLGTMFMCAAFSCGLQPDPPHICLPPTCHLSCSRAALSPWIDRVLGDPNAQKNQQWLTVWHNARGMSCIVSRTAQCMMPVRVVVVWWVLVYYVSVRKVLLHACMHQVWIVSPLHVPFTCRMWATCHVSDTVYVIKMMLVTTAAVHVCPPHCALRHAALEKQQCRRIQGMPLLMCKHPVHGGTSGPARSVQTLLKPVHTPYTTHPLAGDKCTLDALPSEISGSPLYLTGTLVEPD
jgi:hypothetical protein